MTSQKNLKVTFTVTALISPEEFAKYMGYPAGSPENELNFDQWGQEEFEECICTYASQFSGWSRYFRIIDRKVESVVETDEPWDPAYPPESQAKMKIKAFITSEEPVPEVLPKSDCDAITYTTIKPSELQSDGHFYTEVLITVDQAKARAWVDDERKFYEENDPDCAEGYNWVGNVFKSGFWDSPECAIVEDGITPGGNRDQVDCEYLRGESI